MQNTPIKEFMQREPSAAKPEMPLTRLVELLREGGFRGVPVTDEENRVVGVISETDLFLKKHPVPFSTEKVLSLLGKVIDRDEVDNVGRVHRLKVGDVMTQRACTVSPDTTLEEAAILMHERRLSMVPVVEDESLVGVVRRSDILAILYSKED